MAEGGVPADCEGPRGRARCRRRLCVEAAALSLALERCRSLLYLLNKYGQHTCHSYCEWASEPCGGFQASRSSYTASVLCSVAESNLCIWSAQARASFEKTSVCLTQPTDLDLVPEIDNIATLSAAEVVYHCLCRGTTVEFDRKEPLTVCYNLNFQQSATLSVHFVKLCMCVYLHKRHVLEQFSNFVLAAGYLHSSSQRSVSSLYHRQLHFESHHVEGRQKARTAGWYNVYGCSNQESCPGVHPLHIMLRFKVGPCIVLP